MRPLSERHTGLLIRMSFHRSSAGTKRIHEPLVKRGYATTNTCGNYELTEAGKKAAKQAIKDNEGKHLKTFGGISIGSAVMIVTEG